MNMKIIKNDVIVIPENRINVKKSERLFISNIYYLNALNYEKLG